MTSDTRDLPATTQATDDKRQLALLRALGLDKAAPEQRELALAIASRYDLDPMLRHLVLIDGKPFISRDGLLWVAHRSHQLDGIAVEPVEVVGKYYRTTATVWRKDMSHPFTYAGRYPVEGKNRAYGEEMAIKVAESMALRRAFNVAAPSADERWAEQAEQELADTPKGQTLAEKASALAAAIRGEPEEATSAPETAQDAPEPVVVVSEPVIIPDCGAVAEDGLMAGAVCILEHDHKGAHKSADGSWPR